MSERSVDPAVRAACWEMPFTRLCLHELFEQRVAQQPDRVALRLDERWISYGELDTAAERLAVFLQQSGVGPDTPVAILLDRSFDQIIAILAVLKAGGVYVPLDGAFPETRLRAIIDDCSPRLLLTDAAGASRLGTAVETVCLGEVSRTLHGIAGARRRYDTFHSAMYIVHTSGSTGRPKGIVQTHEALSNLIQWQNTCSGIDCAGATLQFSSISFDVHLQEIFATLAAGGSVVLMTEESRLDPARLLDVIRRHSVTTAFLSVSIWSRVVTVAYRQGALPESLTDVVVAGEQLLIHDDTRALLRGRPLLRLHNHYGVSESHVVTAQTFTAADDLPTRAPIGRPIANVRVRLGPPGDDPPARGEMGEIFIGGIAVARGYVNNPAQTTERFLEIGGTRWYRTGDLARYLEDGSLEFLGRVDAQVKVRGHLVELGDVEVALASFPGVAACAAALKQVNGEPMLVGYYLADDEPPVDLLRAALETHLPSFMVPSRFVRVERFPVGPTGKIDRAALPDPPAVRPPLAVAFADARTPAENAVSAVVSDVLGVTSVGIHDNFFDLGLTSVTCAQANELLTDRGVRGVSVVDWFAYPTVAQLAERLDENTATVPSPSTGAPAVHTAASDVVAIVGMAGRFPGAADTRQLWENLLNGVEGLTEVDGNDRAFFLPGGSPGTPVRRLGLVDDFDRFDASFFKLSALDALWLDPQHRLFLECAWEALEDAGCDPDRYDGRIGVFAGCAETAYLVHVRPFIETMGDYLRALAGNDKDFLATRASYLFNLTGPSVTVQTACSTALVAFHLAHRAIQQGDCTMALAGAVSAQMPQTALHFSEPGLIYSPDGRTRPFGAGADGTNITNGGGVVVLKRYDEARRDHDHIYAIVKATAVNNDGRRKVGFAAPGVAGQIEVLRDACRAAGVGGDDIDYVEAHGTATAIGDPIEARALVETYRRDANSSRPLVLGSIKGNIGHMNRAAGIAGLIKAALVAHHREVPPTINLSEINPELRLDGTGLAIATSRGPIGAPRRPVRTAVSAFGIGGTNAHAILEGPPLNGGDRPDVAPAPSLITLAARTPTALRQMAAGLARHLNATSGTRLGDVAFSRNLGRQEFEVRAAIVATTISEAITALTEVADGSPRSAIPPNAGLAFMFPGQGAEVLGMGARLYGRYAAFRAAFDRVASAVRDRVGEDLHDFRLATSERPPRVNPSESSRLAQPWLFATEFALFALLRDWGVRPDAVIGHSTGEYSAACAAGILTPEDTVTLLGRRGELMDTVAPRGGMIAAFLDGRSPIECAVPAVTIGAWNSREHVAFSGPCEALDALEERLTALHVEFRRLRNHNPNHTSAMQQMAVDYAQALETVQFHSPSTRFISNLLGCAADGSITGNPEYWIRHACEPVRFAEGLDALARDGCSVFMEIGPQQILSRLAAFHHAGAVSVIPALPGDGADECATVLHAVGRAWEAGRRVDWRRFHDAHPGRRIPLPSYPFERQRYWLPFPESATPARRMPPARVADPTRWSYGVDWERTRPAIALEPGDLASESRWLVFHDGTGFGLRLLKRLRSESRNVVGVRTGEAFAESPGEFVIRCDQANDYSRLFDRLRARDATPDVIVHLWSCREVAAATSFAEVVDAAAPSLFSVVLLAQAVASANDGRRTSIVVVRSTDPRMDPVDAAALVIQQEQPNLAYRVIAVDRALTRQRSGHLTLLAEIRAGGESPVVLSGGQRLVRRFVARPLAEGGARGFQHGGHYLITGGLGRVGAMVARELMVRYDARLTILGRTVLTSPSSETTVGQATGVHAERLRELTRHGRVEYRSVDVCDVDAVEAAVRDTEASLGPVQGLLHAAATIGQDDFSRFLADISVAELTRQLAPKPGGWMALQQVFRSRDLDLRIAFSSLATVLGGFGYLPYAAANASLAAVSADDPAWTVVSWDVWDLGRDSAKSGGLESSVQTYAMAPAEAFAWLERCARARGAHVFLSTCDLDSRIAAIMDRMFDSPSADEEAAIAPSDSIEPSDEVMAIVVGAWQRTLGVRSVALRQRFTDLGGDSLSATKVVLQINRRLGLRITLGDVLKAGTVDALCRTIRQQLAAVAGTGGIERLAGRTRYLASPLQERWFELERQGFGYLQMPVRIRGPLHLGRFLSALQASVDRHESLRTRFEVEEGRLHQIVSPGSQLPVTVVDLESIAPHLREAAVRGWLEDVRARRFALLHEVAVEAWLLRFTSEEHIFFLLTHHILFDGWSSSVFLSDLDRAYASGASPQPAALQYGDYAEYTRREPAASTRDCDRRFWASHFEGSAGPLQLCPPNCRDDSRAGRIQIFLEGDALAALDATAAAERTTLFQQLLTAFVLLLFDATGESDIVIGTTSAGRQVPGTEEIVGVFVNPLPLRFRVDAARSLTQFKKDVHRTLDGFYQHQAYTVLDLAREVEPFPALGLNGAFRAYVLFQNYEQPRFASGLDYTVVEVDDLSDDSTLRIFQQTSVSLMRDVELVIYRRADGLSCNLWYRHAALDFKNARVWADVYRRFLRACTQTDVAACTVGDLCSRDGHRAAAAVPTI